jgi:type I restriction enzyme, S subunit
MRSPEQAEGPFMVRYLRAANVKDGYVDLSDVKEMNFTPAEQDIFSLRKGDVLVSEGAGSLAAVGASAVWDGPLEEVVCFQNTLLRLSPLPERASPRFLAWWARHAYGSGLLASAAIGVNIYHLSADRVRSLPVSFPGVPEQERIADFLDRETTRIDALVAARKRLIARLRERWRSEVAEAVTGVRHSGQIALTDSTWFARMPADWRREPLKRRWTVLDCKHRTPEYVDEGYPLVSHGEIEDGRVHPGRSGRFVGEADYLDLIEGRSPKRGDIIYTRNAAIGNAGYVDTDEAFAMGQDVCLITSDDQDQRFLTYFLNSVAVEQLAAQRLGATFGRINVAQIVDLQILCPPAQEQRVIANHLDTRRERYEPLTRSLSDQVALLNEHRQTLITAAVGGRIRGVQSEVA